MSVQAPSGRARAGGSTHSGVAHFWQQRLTAIALLPLTLWFVWSIARFVGAPYADVVAFLADPFNAAAMLLFVIVSLYHMVLGIQVIIEDYIPNEGSKRALLFLNNFVALAIGAVCAIAVVPGAIRTLGF